MRTAAKNSVLSVILYLLVQGGAAFSQTLVDYVSAVKGDTLVIKDYYDMNRHANSLYYALLLDSVNVPAGRVYELRSNGYYPSVQVPHSSSRHATVIVGSDRTPVVNNRNVQSSPPVICSYPAEAELSIGMVAEGDLTIRNCALVSAAADGTINWVFAQIVGPNLRLVLENCLMEQARWVFIAAPDSNCDVIFRDCYFVNMNGQPGRRLGGVFDCLANQDTLIVENCTHVIAQGNLYGFRGYPFHAVRINHNTFVNCLGSVFLNVGYQSNMTLTSNIFINCNLHPHDRLYSDLDEPPMGLVNVSPDTADSVTHMSRKFLVQDNLVYWDPSLTRLDSMLNANLVNGSNGWESQTIIMNLQTREMFDDDVRYPFLVTDSWKQRMPLFTEPRDLFTTQLATIRTFVLEAAGDTELVTLPDWRLISSGQGSQVHPDWPIPVVLSYSDADFLNAGMNGFPLGDLNWFPARKSAWLAQRTAEYASIDDALIAGRLVTAVRDQERPSAEFQLGQNHPNPFNPKTVISSQLPVTSEVKITVYDLLGREVAVLVNERREAGSYQDTFDATGLASGVYYIRLSAGGNMQTKKALLIR